MKICATMSLQNRIQLLHKIPFCHTIEPPRVLRNPWRLSSLVNTQCSEQHTMLPPNADSAWPAARTAARPPAWAPASDLVDVEWANMHCAREITLPSARLDRNKGWRCIVEGQGTASKEHVAAGADTVERAPRNPRSNARRVRQRLGIQNHPKLCGKS